MNIMTKVRVSKGLTQLQLAESVGFTQGLISQIESENGSPSFKLLLNMVRYGILNDEDLLEIFDYYSAMENIDERTK